MEPRQQPAWLRLVLNACAHAGLGVTLMGWVKPAWGMAVMAVGFLYVMWEIGPWVTTHIRRKPLASLLGFVFVGAIVGAATWWVWKSAIKTAAVIAIDKPVLPPVISTPSIQQKSRESDLKLRSSSAARKTTPIDEEIRQRNHVLEGLRKDYILQNTGVDPEIIAGKRWPPADWMNQRLKALGETWRVGA